MGNSKSPNGRSNHGFNRTRETFRAGKAGLDSWPRRLSQTLGIIRKGSGDRREIIVIRKVILCSICIAALLGACTRSLSPEEQALVQALRTELEATKKEVAAAEAQYTQYSGGLIKVLIGLRLEVLKTNEALIQQRIHAIESGARVTIQTAATKPDPERAKQLEAELTKQELKVSEAEGKASAYSGGLVGAMALMSVATERNTLAMLRQQYLIAKHGLAFVAQDSTAPTSLPPAVEAAATEPGRDTKDPEEELREQILDVALLRKQYTKQDYQDYIFFDIAFTAKGLDKPARAIKGSLRFTDLFGEQKFALRWTVEKPIAPGASYTEKGSGFKYNQFTDSHQWVRNTEKDNMKVKFRVDSILYEDGTTRDFE